MSDASDNNADDASMPSATPPDARAALVPPRGPIVALRVVGRDKQLELPAHRPRFLLGAAGPPTVDLTVADPMVSRTHALLTRKGYKLQVVDQGSTNGTYFRGFRDPDFEVMAGDIFAMSRGVELLALDPPLASLRHRLLWVLGLRANAAADAAVTAIAGNGPLLFLAPPHCEQVRLAQEIHIRSPFADRSFVVAEGALRGDEGVRTTMAAADGTLFLDLTGRQTAPPESFLVKVFAHCRPIFAAANETQAAELLEGYFHRCRPIRLVPPCLRKDEIPRLLDALLAVEHRERQGEGEPPKIAALGDSNVAGLKAHPWPGHFDDLRFHAPRLYALLTHGINARAAARALGLKSVASLIESLGRIGVHVSRRPDDDEPLRSGAGDDEHLPTPPGAPTGQHTPRARRATGGERDRSDDE